MTDRLALSRRRLAFALAGLGILGFGAYGALPALAQAAAYLLPALLLLLALAVRRYPGEQALLALAGKLRQHRPRPRLERKTFGQRPGRATFPRGGALIASSLAERAPPLAVAALT